MQWIDGYKCKTQDCQLPCYMTYTGRPRDSHLYPEKSIAYKLLFRRFFYENLKVERFLKSMFQCIIVYLVQNVIF